MENPFDIADSTDWLSTPLSNLAPLDSSLRCQVCKDFFDTPVITSCSHTFCSLCIRRCLSNEGKCPACRRPDQEMKLRRNWAVQEIADAFVKARSTVLDLAREAQESEGQDQGQDQGQDPEGLEQPAMKKRKIGEKSDAETVVVDASEGRRTRSQSRRDSETQAATVEVVEDSHDDEHIPDDGLVACPICSRRMKNEAVFQHLDTCTGNPAPPKQASFGSLQPMSRAARPRHGQIDQSQERLPAINYMILKDQALRKKLRDLGIPDWGPRPLLQRRHTEWVNLWNANCDSARPKQKRELIKDLDTWERTQGGNAPLSFTATGNTVMNKDFDKDAWSASNGDDYKRLIANARRNDKLVRSTIPKAESQDAAVPDESVQTPNSHSESHDAGASTQAESHHAAIPNEPERIPNLDGVREIRVVSDPAQTPGGLLNAMGVIVRRDRQGRVIN